MNARSLAGIAGFLAVALGAFGAHGLKAQFDAVPLRGEWWEKAVLYHLVHAVAILATARPDGRASRVSWCFAAGILVFSGTLYAMALGAPREFGAVTPIGGLAFLAGWLGFVLRRESPRSSPSG